MCGTSTANSKTVVAGDVSEGSKRKIRREEEEK
jgi:hypothetical protein